MTQDLASSLHKLNPKERIYVQNRLDGLTQKAAGAAAGLNGDLTKFERKPHIVNAMMVASSQIAEEIGFSRKEAHEMLMSAYQNAATAAEQIQAVKEMINLHGIAAPKVVEHEHKHTGSVSLEQMETSELMKLADMEDLTLEGDFSDVTDDNDDTNQKALPDLR